MTSLKKPSSLDFKTQYGLALDAADDAIIVDLFAGGGRLWCLGTTKDGHPRHPLYVRGNQVLLPWVPRVTP